MPVTDAELRGLLMDCLAVWEVPGKVEVEPAEIAISAGGVRFGLRRAGFRETSIRWTLTSPGQRPRHMRSIGAVLRLLRRMVCEERMAAETSAG
jgi:hypothetical protein